MSALHNRMRRLALAASPLLVLALAACNDAQTPTSLDAGDEAALVPTAASAAATSQLTVADFIAAQGTWCTATGGPTGCTSLFGAEGPADVLVWCDYYNGEPYPCFYGDLGVDERFMQEQTGQGYGSRYAGTVTERPLGDGRRLVKVKVHGTNVLMQAMDLTSLEQSYADPVGISNAMIVGESPYELVHHLREPTLGDLHFDLEIVLPADYVGLPDLVELFFEPAPGMEVRSFRILGNMTGVTRKAFGEIPSGVLARLTANMPWNLELAGKLPEHAVARGLRVTEFSPGVHISLKQLGR